MLYAMCDMFSFFLFQLSYHSNPVHLHGERLRQFHCSVHSPGLWSKCKTMSVWSHSSQAWCCDLWATFERIWFCSSLSQFGSSQVNMIRFCRVCHRIQKYMTDFFLNFFLKRDLQTSKACGRDNGGLNLDVPISKWLYCNEHSMSH